MTSVGLVVPAFRPDPETLAAYVEELDEELDARIRIEVDDPDPAVEEALQDVPAEVNAVDTRGGKGAAITRGFEALVDGVEVLGFADADGSTPAPSVGDVLAPVESGDADLAVGSRRHPDSDIRSHQTITRRRMGDAFARVAGRLLDVELYDYQCGAKALSSDTWRAVRPHIYESGFAWDIELVAMTAALGRSVREVPVTWVDKPDSTVSPLPTALELGRALLRSRHRAKRLAGSRLHSALADPDGTALVDRTGYDPADD
ncbi:dolichol-P-glucose transferase [Halobacteriales archaeon QS_8_69_26]|nr:MAG: dolichol-P-glucose transferase [Halobacteriales archaeon QS_8_69_26]